MDAGLPGRGPDNLPFTGKKVTVDSHGTQTLLILHCCFGPEDLLHNYVSFIRIPVHYFSYDILQTKKVPYTICKFC